MSTVVIELDGVDITAMVKIATASFGSAVNGVGGTCSFEIRDLDHVFGPIVGKKLTVTIDGALKWAGYALSAARQYGFAVDDTSRPDKTERLFLMQGVDNNVLFQKRVVWNKDHPTHGELPAPVGHRCASPRVGEWAEDTRTDVIIPYLIENYTSMFSDGVTMDVDDFGSPMPDDCGAVSGGVTVGDMMADLNRSLNGVFYLMPDYTFRYHAADTVTTDWILTDKPSGDHDIGPRSYSFLSDGSRMVNDALVWATALGWDTVTFSRAQDHDDSGQVSSITDHGRWQYGEFNTQMHRQATVDERAHTIVYGLDSSQQGARWDQIVVEATTSRSVFNLGDVVTCRAESYTGTLREPFNAPDGNGVGTDVLEIALPIRRMQITFLSPTEPRFTMVLTRELDDPFSAFESRFPPFRTPRGFKPPVIDYPGPFPGPPGGEPGICPPCLGTALDDWDRTDGAGFGTASGGLDWAPVAGLGVVYTVEPGHGIFTVPTDSDGPGQAELPIGDQTGLDVDITFTDCSFSSHGDIDIDTNFFVPDIEVDVNSLGVLGIDTGADTVGSFPTGFDLLANHFNFRFFAPADRSRVDAWLWLVGTDMPETPTGSVASGVGFSANAIDTLLVTSLQSFSSVFPQVAKIGPIYSGPGVCPPLFDDFDRSEAGPDWGPATPSGANWVSGGAGSVSMAVQPNNPTNPNWPQSVGGGFETHAVNAIGYQIAPLPFAADAEFTCTFEFLFDQIFGAPIMVEWIVAFGDGSGANTGVVMMIQHDAFGADSTVQVTTPDGASSQETFTFVGGTAYTGEFKVAADTAEFRVWAVGDSRPDDPIASAGMGGNPLNGTDMLVLATQPPTPGNFNVTWDSWMHTIDFDYDGRPCSYDCSPAIQDSFGRADGALAGSTTEVGGKTWAGTSYPSVAIASNQLQLGGGDFVLWNSHFDLPIDVPASITHDTVETAYPSLGTNNVICHANSGTLSISAGITSTGSIDLTLNSIPPGSSVSATLPFSPTDNTFGITTLTITSDGASMVTPLGEISVLAADATPTPLGPITVVDSFAFSGSSSTNPFVVDDLSISGPCVPVYAPTSSVPPPVGPGAELATYLTDTLRKVSRPFVSGSTHVTINGATLQQGADKDYTENPTTGTITLNTAHPASDKVYVSYVAVLPSTGTIPANAYYIAPAGDDSTGDGSAAHPWQTIRKFANVAVPGDTLLCRGGHFMDVPRLILASGDTAGTAAAHITVRNYPGEAPVFHGAGTGSFSQFVMVTDGVAYWDFDGLWAQDFKVGSSGVFYVGRNVGLTVPTHHVTVRNCMVTMVHEGGGPFNHCVYLSAYAEDCTIQDNIFIGASVSGSDGEGCNIGDHEPSPQRTIIKGNVFSNFGNAGGIWWNGDLNTGSILHNTFINCVRWVSLRYYVSVTVRDNAGQAGSSADIDNVNDATTGVATIDHNFSSQTFDSNYFLLPGNTGIKAATDGSDAGAKNT